MPAPAERPDDVLHRPDRRDDDAHLLRKPGPPHLRRPRNPHPQTARRRRRHEITAPYARHAGTKQAVHLTRSRGDAEKDAEKTNPRTDLTEGAGFASSQIGRAHV